MKRRRSGTCMTRASPALRQLAQDNCPPSSNLQVRFMAVMMLSAFGPEFQHKRLGYCRRSCFRPIVPTQSYWPAASAVFAPLLARRKHRRSIRKGRTKIDNCLGILSDIHGTSTTWPEGDCFATQNELHNILIEVTSSRSSTTTAKSFEARNPRWQSTISNVKHDVTSETAENVIAHMHVAQLHSGNVE
jgi:hypothetical protein